MEMDKSNIVELDLDQPNQAELTLQQLRNLRYIAKKLKEQNELDTLVVHVITGGQVSYYIFLTWIFFGTLYR